MTENKASRFAVNADYNVGREVCYYDKLVQANQAVENHKLSPQCTRVTVYDGVKRRTVRIFNLHSGVWVETKRASYKGNPKARPTKRRTQKIRIGYYD